MRFRDLITSTLMVLMYPDTGATAGFGTAHASRTTPRAPHTDTGGAGMQRGSPPTDRGGTSATMRPECATGESDDGGGL